jgi:hypothetical protein
MLSTVASAVDSCGSRISTAVRRDCVRSSSKGKTDKRVGTHATAWQAENHFQNKQKRRGKEERKKMKRLRCKMGCAKPQHGESPAQGLSLLSCQRQGVEVVIAGHARPPLQQQQQHNNKEKKTASSAAAEKRVQSTTLDGASSDPRNRNTASRRHARKQQHGTA